MIFPSEDKWTEYHISEEHHKFFFLRWQELFDPNVFDSWQVPYANLTSIFHELLEAVGVVTKVHSYHPNLKELIDEANQIAKQDIVIAESFPFIKECLSQLLTIYNQDIKNQNQFDSHRFVSMAKVGLANLNTYKDKLIQAIRNTLDNPGDNYKKRFGRLITSLAIELKSQGYSSSKLNSSFKLLISDRDFPEKITLLLSEFSSETNCYTCKFHVSWPGEQNTFHEQNITLSKDRSQANVSAIEEEFFNSDAESTIATIKIDALDEFSAIHKAREKLGSVLAISKLYNVTKTPSIRKLPALIGKQDNTFDIIDYRKDVSYIRDAKNSNANISRLFKLLQSLNTKDADQILASLQYHQLSQVAPTDESKLVNLWIALESLIQDGGASIIDRMCGYIPDTNSTTYCNQMLKGALIGFKSYWRENDSSTILTYCQHSNSFKLKPNDFLTFLTDEYDGKKITAFLAYCSKNPLLVHRIYSLWEIFSTPKNLSQRIASHHQRIKWQIRRIYRTRNQIMHRGAYSKDINQLIQNLHSYFILTIHNLIHDLKENEKWTIKDALEYRKSIFNYFIARLKDTRNQPISSEMILKPQLALVQKAVRPVWN